MWWGVILQCYLQYHAMLQYDALDACSPNQALCDSHVRQFTPHSCVMLLALMKKSFPVDTNVARVCARLGWIPLQVCGQG